MRIASAALAAGLAVPAAAQPPQPPGDSLRLVFIVTYHARLPQAITGHS